MFPLLGASRYTPRRLWKFVRPSNADVAGPKGTPLTGRVMPVPTVAAAGLVGLSLTSMRTVPPQSQDASFTL